MKLERNDEEPHELQCIRTRNVPSQKENPHPTPKKRKG